MSEFYILDKDHNVVPATLHEWARFFESADRIVEHYEADDVRVSTVFLGIDHGFGWLSDNKKEPPLVFETMIFGGKHNQYQDRCYTWEEAKDMHAKALKLMEEDK